LALLLGAACKQEAPVAQGGDDKPRVEVERPATVEIGKTAPMVTIANSHNWEGDLPNLDDMQGKVVVLDFWAYW
jgi:hypothetical protein